MRLVGDMWLTQTCWSGTCSEVGLQISTNVKIKNIRRAARGFRNFGNYQARIMLHAGQPRNVPTTTRIRSYTLTTAA